MPHYNAVQHTHKDEGKLDTEQHQRHRHNNAKNFVVSFLWRFDFFFHPCLMSLLLLLALPLQLAKVFHLAITYLAPKLFFTRMYTYNAKALPSISTWEICTSTVGYIRSSFPPIRIIYRFVFHGCLLSASWFLIGHIYKLCERPEKVEFYRQNCAYSFADSSGIINRMKFCVNKPEIL